MQCSEFVPGSGSGYESTATDGGRERERRGTLAMSKESGMRAGASDVKLFRTVRTRIHIPDRCRTSYVINHFSSLRVTPRTSSTTTVYAVSLTYTVADRGAIGYSYTDLDLDLGAPTTRPRHPQWCYKRALSPPFFIANSAAGEHPRRQRPQINENGHPRECMERASVLRDAASSNCGAVGDDVAVPPSLPSIIPFIHSSDLALPYFFDLPRIPRFTLLTLHRAERSYRDDFAAICGSTAPDSGRKQGQEERERRGAEVGGCKRVSSSYAGSGFRRFSNHRVETEDSTDREEQRPTLDQNKGDGGVQGRDRRGPTLRASFSPQVVVPLTAKTYHRAGEQMELDARHPTFRAYGARAHHMFEREAISPMRGTTCADVAPQSSRAFMECWNPASRPLDEKLSCFVFEAISVRAVEGYVPAWCE
ncbi:hypothetical protein DFH09DRAFT_1290391, partial [Mycena vulgaris]